jgi:hypothetical protein
VSAVVYLFLAHLGIGIAFTLLLVSKEAGIKFFRFNAGLAAGLIAAALAFRPDAAVVGGGVVTPGAVTALGVALGALTVYWIIAGRAFGKLRPLLATVAALAGAAAIIFHGLAAPSSAGPALTAATMLTSAGLLGGACTAMVLGHWYLVIPSMQVTHLQRAVGFHIVTLVLRVIVVGVVLAVAMSSPLASGSSVGRYITSLDGVFFWQRVLFGLAGPALLSYMTWETAKIQSTQSATGILYVDFFTVVVGEVLANYVLLSAGLAL